MRITQADPLQDAAVVRELFWEYLQWANEQVNTSYGVNFDIRAMLEEDMRKLDIFMPPGGRLLLSEGDGAPSGMACLRENEPGVAEIKRMYVRPACRRQGLGRALLHGLLEEARAAGWRTVRLDSAGFMREAHSLYRSLGFREIGPYPGSEIPPEFQQHWVFMELALSE